MSANSASRVRDVELAFVILEISEAQHALHMARGLIERAKRGEPYNADEASAHITRGSERAALACKNYLNIEGRES